MTTSEWDGTPWAGAASVQSKAEIGPFVAQVQYGSPLSSLSNSPQKRYAEAQGIYHSNPWVRTAETTVTRRVVGLPWHLEDGEDNEVDDADPGRYAQPLTLLERPQQALSDVGQKMTRRTLWAITSRHLGLCGVAYWYLDQLDPVARTPLGIVYVNPARVWAACDDRGNLRGWVIDAKDNMGHGGVPLALDELLPFYLDPPDAGHYPTGLAHAAWQKAQITNLADRHAAYVLGTGGRLAGIVSPKEGTIPDEAYQALVREFRNVNEAPDAAKRTTILRGPTEFTPTGADPSDLLLTDIAKMNRDDILAIWGVPPSQAGIPTAGGLNSGETRKYDEATLMQGAVHDRVTAMREAIQYGLLDRYAKLGLAVELEIEEPEFDDAGPMYENAVRAVNLPMTNAERRALVGLDPLGIPAVDNAIVLPVTLMEYGAAIAEPEQKAAVPREHRPFLGLRRSVEARWVPSLRKQVGAVLDEQASEVAERIRTHAAAIIRKPRDASIWWNAKREDERLGKVLRAGSVGIAQTVAGRTKELLAPAGKAAEGEYEQRVVKRVADRTAERVTGINATTREAIQAAILDGFDAGLSPLQVADGLASLPAFDLARGELVARTEAMLAYNDAALTSYGEFGVTEVLAYDGDEDDECRERNGRPYPVTEAWDITDHPHGTLDWAPIAEPVIAQAVAAKAMTMPLRIEVAPPQYLPAPVVTVEPTIVHVPPAEPPVVNVDLSAVSDALTRITTRQARIVRDAEGRITGMETT